MDDETKARYQSWKQRKVLKRVLPLAGILLVIFGGLILGLSSCSNDEENGRDASTDPPTDINVVAPINETDEPSETEGELTSPNREPIVFCGAADPEHATILTDEEALDYLALVNRCYRVSSEFSPHDLRIVNVEGVNFPNPHYHASRPVGVHELRESAATALEALFEEAEAVGLHLILSSAYRNYDLQNHFHVNAIGRMGLEEARRWSAIPGHSEHQLGLGVDLTTPALEAVGWLHNDFTDTLEGSWVRENGHRFGFILSFPDGRESDTGIGYEPWHIRYVGVEAATNIFNNGLILEEYLWYLSD